MAKITDSTTAELNQALDRLLLGQLAEPLEGDGDGLAEAFEKLEALRRMLVELQAYTVELSQGEIDVTAPPRKNYLASGLKQLQAQLRHVTWQAQCIAGGDYGQHIDFMGDFSEAFNTMRDQLRIREESLVAQRNAMFNVFDTIEPIVVVKAGDRDAILYANYMARLYFTLDTEQPLRASGNAVAEALFAMPASTEQEVSDPVSGRWFTVTCAPLPWSDHEQAVMFHCIDITSHKEQMFDLQRAADTDSLTGLINRGAFDAAFKQEWKRAQRSGTSLAYMIFDLDHFKTYNDTYGHAHGDKCLTAFARALQGSIGRARDIVARYGGEEFVALLPDTCMEGARTVAEAARKSVELLAIPYDEDPDVVTRITVSVGVSAVVPDADMEPFQLAMAADKALYEAKEAGRNRICTSRAIGVDHPE